MKIKNVVVGLVLAWSVWFSPLVWGLGYTFSDLGTLGGDQSFARRINDYGQIVGSSYTGTGSIRATMWSNGSIVNLSPGSSVLGSQAIGINNDGQIVGSEWTSTTPQHAVLWNGGTTKSLAVGQSSAHAINNSGQIVGVNPMTNPRGVMWSDGNQATLGLPSNAISLAPYPTVSQAVDLNSSGQIVGFVQTYNMVEGNKRFVSQATLWNGTSPTSLSFLAGSNQSSASAINDFGLIVGTSSTTRGTYDSFNVRATTWFGDIVQELDTLGGYSVAMGVNNAGQVVGQSTTADGKDHATIWNGNEVIDLNSVVANNMLGWTLEYASDINNLGQIVGVAKNQNGKRHGFLLTDCGQCVPYVPPPPPPVIDPPPIVVINPPPIVIDPPPIATPVPEPETCAMMLAGLGLLGVFARRRKQKLNA